MTPKDYAAQGRGPVHVLDAGRYYAEVVDGIPMIFRADTAGAVTRIDRRPMSDSAWTFSRYWREVAMPYYRFVWRFWFGR